jgi:hypothetical protein
MITVIVKTIKLRVHSCLLVKLEWVDVLGFTLPLLEAGGGGGVSMFGIGNLKKLSVQLL